jgi:hypothetical protein
MFAYARTDGNQRSPVRSERVIPARRRAVLAGREHSILRQSRGERTKLLSVRERKIPDLPLDGDARLLGGFPGRERGAYGSVRAKSVEADRRAPEPNREEQPYAG